MKSVKRKGLALVAVSSSMVGVGIGMASNASALAWAQAVAGPTADLQVTGTVAGTGSSAVLTVNTNNAGSNGNTNTTAFGDGATTTGATGSHAYAAGKVKQTLTETSVNTYWNIQSTTQVGVDGTDPAHVAVTKSTPINMAADGAVINSQGTSSFDLSKILPASADLSQLSGTCDHGSGALALTIDSAAKTAVCNWTGANAAGFHIVTLTYTDKATGLVSTAQDDIWVPVQPVASFKAAVLSPGLVQVDVTGSQEDVGSSTGAGIIDWGDGSKTSVPLPLRNDSPLHNHQYATPGSKTITFSITDRFGEHAASTATVDVTKANVDYGQLTRFSGATRYGTGVAVSQEAFPFAHSANAVVLARGDVYADALAGIPLAKYKNGPLLLTPGGPNATTLDPNVAAEIQRVLPADKNHTVYILGGTAAIPQAVQDYISNNLGYNVERFGGATRYETALDVAQSPQALNNPKHVVVARGDDFADALASGPFASDKFADSGVPAAIVLSSGNGITDPVSLSDGTLRYVEGKLDAAHPAGQPNVAAIGGGAVRIVGAIAASNPGSYTPIMGADRYDTAAKVAAVGWGNQPTGLGVASGLNFPDSLTGGALMALQGNPLLLSNPGTTTSTLAPAAAATVTADKASVKNTYLFGGTAVFGNGVAQNIIQLEGLSAAHYRIADLPF
jgi:putative cell wall-binding protein